MEYDPKQQAIAEFLDNMSIHCILRGWIKGYNSSVTAIMCQRGSYRIVVG